jgi:hypothetical protein
MIDQTDALYEAFTEAKLKATEAELKMLKAEKAATTALAAHARAERAEHDAFERWRNARQGVEG